MAKHNTGQLIGSIYDTVGCSNKASTDQITKASQRYSETARNPDCPAITEAVATEITRIVSSPGVRATYDQGLAIGNPWPIDLPLTVRIGTVGISPLVETKFCDRCRAFSAKDITIPRFRLTGIGFLHAAEQAKQTQFRRGVSPFIVRRCKPCGQQEVRKAPKSNWIQLDD
jgi:hypothetical protein